MSEGRFWCVWNPERRPPSVVHLSRDLAEIEAKRLAAMNPGELFVVLKAVSVFGAEISPPVRRPLGEALDRAAIPF